MADHNHICQLPSAGSVFQTFDELEFERGIWFAAQNGDLQRIKKLLSQGVSVDKRDNAGYTALHYAARAGNMEICKFLLANGADINATTRSGKATALHRAAFAGKYEIVKLLLDRNADFMVKDSDGKTVLHRAAESQHLAICQEIVKMCPSLKKVVDNRGKVAFDYIRNNELSAALSLKNS